MRGIAELKEFHTFLTGRVQVESLELSPEEALDEWRQSHPSPELAEEDSAAIQEALDDVAKGDRGLPFAQFDHEFRIRHGIEPGR